MKIGRPSPAMAISCIALFIALGAAARASNTIFSTDIVDGQVKSVDLANSAVTSFKIAVNSIGTGRVIDNSLTLLDLAGADASGFVSLPAVTIGRCNQFTINVAGAKAGDVPVIATQAAVQTGVFLYAMRTPSDGYITISVCNLSGVNMNPITDLPIRVITFR